MKFLLNILKYILLTLLISFFVEKTLDQLFIQVSKRSSTHLSGRDSDILILGSSRAQHNIIPNYLDSLLSMSVINLGKAGSSPLEMFYTLKLYLMNNEPPKIILAEFYGNISDEHATKIGRIDFLPYYNANIIDDYFLYCDDKVYYDIPLYRYVFYPSLGWREHIKIFSVNRMKNFHNGLLGYTPLPKKFKPYGYKPSIQNEIHISSHLDSLINLCNKKNISFISFTSPVLGSVNEMEILTIKNNFNYYINQSNILDSSKYFRDETHVNHYGAKKQTLHMAKYLSKVLKIK